MVAASVDVGASGLVFGDGAFDDAWADAQAPGGQQVVQDAVADEVDDGVGDDAGGQGELVAGGLVGDGEAAAVGVDPARPCFEVIAIR